MILHRLIRVVSRWDEFDAVDARFKHAGLRLGCVPNGLFPAVACRLGFFGDALRRIAARIVKACLADGAGGRIHLRKRRREAVIGASDLREDPYRLSRRNQQVEASALNVLRLTRAAGRDLRRDQNIRQVQVYRRPLDDLLIHAAVLRKLAFALTQRCGDRLQRPHCRALLHVVIRLQLDPPQIHGVGDQYLDIDCTACQEARRAVYDIRADVVVGLGNQVADRIIVGKIHAHRPTGTRADVTRR